MKLKKKKDKAKRKVKERENDHQGICCCFLNPSIPLSVGFTGEDCGLVGRSPKFPGSAFGPSLMIAVFRLGHPQLPQSSPRTQKTRPATQHRDTYQWL